MIVARNPATAWRALQGEAVILSLDSKVLRGLNAAGSRAWELIDGRRTADEIAAQLALEFEVEPDRARAELGVFIRDLLAKGLVSEVR